MTDFIIKYYFEKHLKSYRLHCKKLIAWLYVMFVSYDWLTTCYVKKTSKRKKKDEDSISSSNKLTSIWCIIMEVSPKKLLQTLRKPSIVLAKKYFESNGVNIGTQKVNLTHTHNFNQWKMKKTESSNINYQLVHKLINLQSLWGVLKLNVLGDDMERCIEQNDTIPSL